MIWIEINDTVVLVSIYFRVDKEDRHLVADIWGQRNFEEYS